ncbi:hypothetical protein ACPPVO_26385 [Dactylosporangium sp. McL0621]|uniref:hypothetical protein n=1 Tax=Dactylosporangium sp. McL0621 TaxID=3415678 RepID=UPI003CF1F0B4
MPEPAARPARARLAPDLYRNDVDQVARVQLAAPNGQLVILGPPGSGKSTALLLLMEKLLRQSARLPVLLSLAGWEPSVESLDDWIVRRISEQYRSARSGPDHLRALAGGFAAPVCGAWAGGVFGALGGVTLRRRYDPMAGMLLAVGAGTLLGAGVGWLAGGAVDGLLVTTATGTGLGLCFGVATALANTSSGWYLTTLLLLGARGRFPFRLLRFLRVAYRKGLLRRQGSVYQFRHVVLQEWALEFSDGR